MDINATTSPALQKQAQLPPKELERINKVAKEFEAMFMTEMFDHMFSGLEVDPTFGGGHGEKVFRGMMIQEYGKMIAKSPSGMGLSDQIQKQMILMQQGKG